MSKRWRHEAKGEFVVEMTVEDRELSGTDQKFADSVLLSAHELFQAAKDYVIPFLSRERPEFSEPPLLDRIVIFPTSEGTYQVRVEFDFPKDEGAYWWARFNVPYPFFPFPYGSDRIYWPIEFGQSVE